MPSASAMAGRLSCSSVKSVCTSAGLIDRGVQIVLPRDRLQRSDVVRKLPPLALHGSLDELSVPLRTASLETDGQRELLAAAWVQRRGVTAKEQIDLAFFGMNAVAA